MYCPNMTIFTKSKQKTFKGFIKGARIQINTNKIATIKRQQLKLRHYNKSSFAVSIYEYSN